MKKLIICILTACLLSSVLAACGAGGEPGVTTIIVGTSNDYPPYCYLDANGDLVGFEKDVLDAVDAKLPQYKFKYEIFDFKSLLTALEAGRCDIAAHQFGRSAEREAKFLFGDVGYFTASDYIVTAPGHTDIHTLDDLAGKKVSAPPASNWAILLEDYNKTHAQNPILIDYFEATPQILEKNLTSGVVDATILTDADVKILNTFMGTNFVTVGDPLSTSEVQHVFRKDEAEFVEAFNAVMEELKAEGIFEKLKQQSIDRVLKQ
jgi:L-cystine transport system substrate-binding protein